MLGNFDIAPQPALIFGVTPGQIQHVHFNLFYGFGFVVQEADVVLLVVDNDVTGAARHVSPARTLYYLVEELSTGSVLAEIEECLVVLHLE
tara:strand:- start:186 stop:458 length:273 start_codon:yes stop_codon:yes gene_type:complete